jgi:uncharacterized FlaG/YvyC family protein
MVNITNKLDSQLYDSIRYSVNDQLHDLLNKDLIVISDKIYSEIVRKITWELLNLKNNV